MRMRGQVVLTLFVALVLLPPAAHAQAASTPPAPTEPLVVLSAQEMAALRARMAAGAREDLVGKSGGTETAMFFQREAGKLGVAEIHRDSDDYHVMLEGSAVYFLGGTLVDAKETAPGEWRGAGVAGGRTVELRPGDMIFVPRGTPHQRSTEGRDAIYSVIKVYADPTPKATPAK